MVIIFFFIFDELQMDSEIHIELKFKIKKNI